MPSHDYHVKWCRKCLGFAKPEVDKYIDDEVRHDFFRHMPFRDFCEHILSKFGSDGLKVAILHMVLDSLAKDFLIHAGYPTLRKLLRTYLELGHYVNWVKDILESIVRCFERDLKELVRDLARYRGTNLSQVPALSSCVEYVIVIYRDSGLECARQISEKLRCLGFNVILRHVSEFRGSEAHDICIEAVAETVAKGVSLKRKRYSITGRSRSVGPAIVECNHVFDSLQISEPCILVVKFAQGGRIIYPHYVHRKELFMQLPEVFAQVKVMIEDFLREAEEGNIRPC